MTAKEPTAIRNRNSEYIDIHGQSLRERVFKILDKEPTSKPKRIIVLLNDPCISYEQHGETVRQYRKQWKTEYRNRQVLNSLSFHNCRGFLYALDCMDRGGALGRGCSVKGSRTGVVCWSLSRAKNRMFVFNASACLGRVEWFETGRVNFWVKKPANWGRVKQLLSYAFLSSGVIGDVQVFDLWAGSAKFKGAHLTVDTGVRLPYVKVDYLKESNGVVAKLGDASDPTKLELEFTYPLWAERSERIVEKLQGKVDVLMKANIALSDSNVLMQNTLGVLVKKLEGVDASALNEQYKHLPLNKHHDYSI